MKEHSGDCFEKNAKVFMDEFSDIPSAVLVHAIVKGTAGEVKGIKFAHCFIEFGDMVADYSNGNDFIGRKEQYYAEGRISYTEKYTLTEVQDKIIKHEVWGGWTKEINSVMDEAYKLLKKKRHGKR